MITGHPLEKIINGPAHHTLHHIYFTVNYGQVSFLHRLTASNDTDYLIQYFTLADRLGHSYRQPASELDPMLDVKKAEAAKRK